MQMKANFGFTEVHCETSKVYIPNSLQSNDIIKSQLVRMQAIVRITTTSYLCCTFDGAYRCAVSKSHGLDSLR